MIDRIIELSIRHRTAVLVASALLAIAGLVAASTTPVDAIPDLSENQVIVFTDWMGHSPREVEDQVSYPLSVSLQGIRGVRVVRSSSDFNFSMVSVIFEDDVDVQAARRRVAERLARASASLPAGVAPALAPDAAATGQVFWYTVEGSDYDPGRLRAVQDWYVRPQLSAVPGVAEVASVGGCPIEYQVNVDPARLRLRGVTLAEVARAVGASNSAVGGHVVVKGNAEYIVRGVGWIGAGRSAGDDRFDQARALRDLEEVAVAERGGTIVRVADVASVGLGCQPRRGVLEKDGREVTGGVVLMAYGENPLEVTRRIKEQVRKLEPGLPRGVRIVPFYDRTPLIRGAIGTVTSTVVEAVLTATVGVLVVLLHVRATLVVAVTLPLAALGSFAVMGLLRGLGLAEIETNIMSLAGIAVSIGVLVDSSIVMTENAMFRLRAQFGDRPVRGDVRPIVLDACRTVGRPIVFSVAIMLLSFLPVFALGGIEGKMFRPLAYTKSFALLTVAVLAITLVPALCTIFLKGRIRAERESWLVRSVIEVYRPVLSSVLDRPGPLAWVLAVTFLVGLAPLGSRLLFLATLFGGLVASGLTIRRGWARILALASLVVIALVADRSIEPLGREFLTPLDEGMVMDMPITVPRASVTQSADDLKARDMVLCRFPEVDMVVGKAGRAETATDPAPLDMIETMVNFRPRELWPRRVLRPADARRQATLVLDALEGREVVRRVAGPSARSRLIDEVLAAALPAFDAAMREYAYQRNREFERDLGGTLADPDEPGYDRRLARWREHKRRLDGELIDRAASTFTRLAIEEAILRAGATDPHVEATLRKVRQLRTAPALPSSRPAGHHGTRPSTPAVDPLPAVDAVQSELGERFAARLLLWPRDRSELAGFGGELDRAVQMPGWTNVWTMPIQNRVDMLATGVNTAVGVRVVGPSLDEVVRVSEEVAAVVKAVPGASDVVADPIRGKGYLEVRIDRQKAARLGVGVGDINEAIETALGGKVVATTIEGRERHPVRVRYGRDWREDETTVRDVLVPTLAPAEGATPRFVPLADVADVRIVEGPATIKGENGMLRNYVRMNVRGRGVVDFVDQAREVVARRVNLPEGVFLEWTGQFEHERRARRTLSRIVPVVVGLIFLILYWTYRDLADAALMMLAVPGAIAGGVFFQWLFGYKFSVTVWIGYIACFGMATATGIIMLVYLREAVDKAGGLAGMSLEELRRAVLEGAVHRLRPKLLTEGTILVGLAPMLWATGVGSEVIKPMAAPVLGGILVADEVIDLLLPVVFYHVRRLRWARLHRRAPVSPAPHTRPENLLST